MLNIKKISPTEFRLHNKLFYVAYTPNNYFEAFRFEIVFQYLLMWFFEEFGVYFYIQKLKLIDDTVLFQLYFYKTYLMVNSISFDHRDRAAGEADTFLDYPDLFKPTINLRYYNRNLLDFFTSLKARRIWGAFLVLAVDLNFDKQPSKIIESLVNWEDGDLVWKLIKCRFFW